MMDTCWNCGCKGTIYLESHANWFCDDCAPYFKVEEEE